VTPKQIRTLRKTFGITQQELADMIAGTQVTIARWETGVSRPTGAYQKALKELAEKAKRKAKG
jgi:DNA-binding transcriptional regulator YiaG